MYNYFKFVQDIMEAMNRTRSILRMRQDREQVLCSWQDENEKIEVGYLATNTNKKKSDKEAEKTEKELEKTKQEAEGASIDNIEKSGQMTLDANEDNYRIHLLSIIGEVEGHECLPSTNKTTKYEHVLPQLASIEDSKEIDGLLIILNTVGGDVEAGLAISEMIASISKPTVSLVLGGSHSIGVPIATSTGYSYIVPTGTMVIHPVRMNGMFIGAPQTYEYFKIIQDRIIGFVSAHSKITHEKYEKLMLNTEQLTKDLGTILVGHQAVDEGLINEVGGIRDAINKLHLMINEFKKDYSS